MRTVRNPSPIAADHGSPEYRHHGRLRCAGVRCEFGKSDIAEVLDLSASGMRLRLPRRLERDMGDSPVVILHTPLGRFQTTVKLIWQVKRAHRCFEIGVTFSSPTPEFRTKLLGIVRSTIDSDAVYVKVA